MIVTTSQLGASQAASPDRDEALSTRLRDLALVDLDALTAGAPDPRVMIAAYAEDVLDALREARARLAALKAELGGADPLNVLDLAPRQRASDTATPGIERLRTRLSSQAEAARSLARLAELAAALAPRLFEADRRR